MLCVIFFEKMRVVILIVTLTSISSGLCSGQRTDTLRSKYHYYYLADLDLRTVGQWILKDSIAPSDNYITFKCMDSLTSKQKKTRDYYFPIFIKIVDKADGALAEVVGSHALSYAKKYPKELADRFKCCSTTQECCTELERFSSYVGTEIMMADDDKKAYNDLVNEMTKNYRDWKTNKALKVLIDKVDEIRRTW
jgi:hypothetical protein